VNRAVLAPLIAACAALAPSRNALAASRARYGGTLRAAIIDRQLEADPALADAPSDAAMLELTASSICRLDSAQRARPILASDISWQGPLRLRIALRPGLRFGNGAALSARDVAASWTRLRNPASLSPYRALLFALPLEGPGLTSTPLSMELPLEFAWPDLIPSLCHPALAIKPANEPTAAGIGAFSFSAERDAFEANLAFPQGRPFLDGLAATFTDERGGARMLALRKAQVAIGPVAGRRAGTTPRAMQATYLAFNLERAGSDFRTAVEATIDRKDLVRFFVPAPSEPMSSLLPSALMPQEPVSRPSPPARQAARSLTLLFDRALPEQRRVAERLQVKLHDLKYAIVLKPISRAQLRAAWATGAFDLMLHAVLLPPVCTAALAIAIEISGRHELLAAELPPLGALSTEGERQRAAVERARALLPSLQIIPLYAQGLNAVASDEVISLEPDGQGLPAFDDAFLLRE
jgi:MarR-like DNA-binding transcriptional regulator SgrR of sgrS sRNA